MASDSADHTSERRVCVTRDLAASAGEVFDLISDPQGHVRIDGSGMLVATSRADRLSRVGDSFSMDMDREPLGDLPMGRYTVVNTVTRIVADRLLEWSVGAEGRTPIGHVYGYEIEPLPDGGARVTSYCDWTDLHPKLRDRLSFPVVPASMLEASMDNLQELLEGPSETLGE
ncbi:SRPBCC family protein [Nocardioides pacificus]